MQQYEKIFPVASASEWAQLSNFTYEDLDVSEYLDIDYTSSGGYATGLCNALPRNVSRMIDLDSSLDFSNPILIHAKDLFVLVWNWGSLNSFNYRYFLLSRNGYLFCEPPSHDLNWIGSFPFFSKVSEVEYSINSHYLSQPIVINTNGALLFGCSGSHFGHWVADMLPLICISAAGGSKASTRILSTCLTDYQIDTLKTICSLPSYQNSLDFSFVNLSSNNFLVLKCPDIQIIAGVSLRLKNSILRRVADQVRYLHLPESYIRPSSRGVYLERGMQNGAYRVRNEPDIVSRFKGQGIDIVRTDLFSFKENICLLRDYDLFIVPLGSGNTHFNLSSKYSSRMLLLAPTGFQRYSSTSALGAGIYLTPRVGNTRFMFCSQTNPDDSSLHAQFSISRPEELEILDHFGDNSLL